MSEIVTRHNASYSGAAKEFNDRLQTLALVRSELKKVPSDMAQELANLNARRHELQLQAFLQAQFLDKAQVPGIGPGRKAVLASHGVETAWDITPVELAGIQGIGPSLKQALFAWRASVENRFTFDASRAVDPSQQRAIQQKYAAKTAQLRGLLTSGSVQLNAIASDLGMKKRDAIAQIGVLQEHTMTMNARLEELTNA